MDPIVLLRFDEQKAEHRPLDAAGRLEPYFGLTSTVPQLDDGITGKARVFVPADSTGIDGRDIESGSTLLTRDCSIRTMIRWGFEDQDDAGSPGQIIARGLGTSAPEYMSYGLRIRSIAPAAIGILEWQWQDVAGVLKTQIGGHFNASDSWIMLTATRRWVSSSEVRLRYYLADELLSEVISADGSIGGGTTGTMTIGHRNAGDRFAGAIDSLQVYNRELTAEEIAATWNRIRYWQPRSRMLFRESHPPSFPMPAQPDSLVQKENALIGDGLGYAAAQLENIRTNFLPHRAYGTVLEDWESVCRTPPSLNDSVETRRARVCARWSQRLGMSVDGLAAALETLLATDFENLELLGFSPTWSDDFATLRTERWSGVPAADWTADAGQLLVESAAAVNLELTGVLQNWKHCDASIGGNGIGAHILAKLVPTALPEDTEAGVYLGDLAAGNVILFGLRFDGADYATYAEAFRGWVSQGATLIDVIDSVAPAAIWLHLHHNGPGVVAIENFRAQWSTTDALETIAGITSSAPIPHPVQTYWGGCYLRSISGATSDVVEIRFDDVVVREPRGHRAFMFYVYRNPALPGRPDIVGANNVLRQLAHAHLHVQVITSKSVLCDDPTTPVDGGPLGGF